MDLILHPKLEIKEVVGLVIPFHSFSLWNQESKYYMEKLISFLLNMPWIAISSMKDAMEDGLY